MIRLYRMVMESVGNQRAAIAEAGLRRVAAGGIGALTMRTVAAEAGCSLGLVQRVVGTRSNLLRECMNRAIARAEARLDAFGFDDLGPREALELLLDVLLADGNEEEGRVWRAFAAESALSPVLGEVYRRQEDEGQQVFAALLAVATSLPEEEVDIHALTLLALVNGLGEQMLLQRCDGAAARRAARNHLSRLLAALEARG